MHGLSRKNDRDARLISAFTCAGLEGCCSDGVAGKKQTIRTHPIGTDMGAGINHWLYIVFFDDQDNESDTPIEIGKICTCRGPYRRTKDLVPCLNRFLKRQGLLWKGTTSATRAGE